MHRYGDDCVAFINGDGEARDVVDSAGRSRNIRLNSEDASDRFNEGKVRFLLSTEAADEGIDLQRNCHCLIHVDLPWNPMRMHQRVGRLNRYGQTKAVEVVYVRNPDTVESRVWDKLTEKITNISHALTNAMAEPEDLQQLVLGMTSPMFFNDLFTEGAEVAPEAFSDWFARKTSKFGDRDVLDTVRQLLGHSTRFDFQQVSGRLPRVDLPDLKPFFASMIAMNGRRIQEADDGFSFLTPELWLTTPRILREYRDVRFVRTTSAPSPSNTVVGVGHALMDEAMKQARGLPACVTALPADIWPYQLFVFLISDKITTTGSTIRAVMCGVAVNNSEICELVPGWIILQRLNTLLGKRTLRRDEAPVRSLDADPLVPRVTRATKFLREQIDSLDLPFTQPEIALVALIVQTPS